MQSFIQSGDFNIDQAGEQLMRIARFIPDFRDQTGNVSVTFSFKRMWVCCIPDRLMEIHGSPRIFTVNHGYPWFHGYSWLTWYVHGSLWISMVDIHS